MFFVWHGGCGWYLFCFFFFNDTATTEIYTLSLHDALPISYGELAIGIALLFGILVRAASFGGLVFMLTLLFSSDYPGAGAPFWQYFGASLSHSVFILCFAAFLIGRADAVWSLKARRKGIWRHE